MGKAVTAIEYLRQPENYPSAPVIILFGEEAFLRAEVFKTLRDSILTGEDAEFSLTAYDGGTAKFSEIQTELATQSMFGGDTRLVRLEDADSFVSAYSDRLEDYLDAPSPSGVLLLQLKALASNTRLYKAAEKKGFLIDCRPPETGAVIAWIRDWAKKRHHLTVASDVPSLMVDLIGTEPGLLDQELARLALLLTDGEKLTAKFVSEQVGSWRLRKVWDLADAVLMGNLQEGFRQLELLFASGETPIGILAQLAATLRRFAAATVFFLDAEKSGHRIRVNDALLKAGVPPFALTKSAEQMKRLGRKRGNRLFDQLLEIDLAMKGSSRVDPRILLERLLIEIGHPALRNRD